MKLEPGQRVRCVEDSGATWALTKGRDYVVARANANAVWLQHRNTLFGFHVSRFKPVVRVPWVLA